MVGQLDQVCPPFTNMTPHGMAYNGLQDYGALKNRSNDVYDQTDADIRSGPMDFNATMALINNQQSKVSPWAPYFQALDEQGVSKVGQDTARPQGLASNPQWWALGFANGNGSGDPYMLGNSPSTNLATPSAPPAKYALAGLKRAGQ